jgi:hypothetical protein
VQDIRSDLTQVQSDPDGLSLATMHCVAKMTTLGVATGVSAGRHAVPAENGAGPLKGVERALGISASRTVTASLGQYGRTVRRIALPVVAVVKMLFRCF